MARNHVVTTTVPIEPAGGKIRLPDPKDFVTATPSAQVQEASHPGRVEGIDYDQWAVAIIDLADAPDRVAAHRIRLERKGYLKVGGDPIVDGYTRPEVYVKPRAQYDRDRAAYREKLERMVAEKRLPDSAIVQPQVQRSV